MVSEQKSFEIWELGVTSVFETPHFFYSILLICSKLSCHEILVSPKKNIWGGIKFASICPNIAISGYRTVCMRFLYFCQKNVFQEVLHLLPFILLWLCNIMHEILVIIFMKMFVQYMWSAAGFIIIIWKFIKHEYTWL